MTPPPTATAPPEPRSFRRRVYELVDAPLRADGTRQIDWFDISIEVLIVLNVAAVMLETVRPIAAGYATAFGAFEAFSVAVFTVEYLLRLWSCTSDPAYARPVLGRLRFALRPTSLVDLLAVAPSYVALAGVDLRFVRVLRLMRVVRVLKLGRYSDSVAVLGRVLYLRRGELAVMGVVLVMLLVLSSGLMYYAEHEAQPDRFGSMPAVLWWAVITLTTIGYGDVYPVTTAGRVLGGVIAVAGIGIVALPTAIIASGFAEELRERREQRRARGLSHADDVPHAHAAHAAAVTCPHCGKALRADPAP